MLRSGIRHLPCAPLSQLSGWQDYCHRLGIANRDIKLDNVLLHGPGERPVVKICDFGYSKDEEAGSICKTACGTPEYMAPEASCPPFDLNSGVSFIKYTTYRFWGC